MAIDITGIINENEFYTHHYLSAILENDLKDVFSDWSREERGERGEQGKGQTSKETKGSPPQQLNALCKRYFSMRDHIERSKDEEAVHTAQYEFFVELFTALGYELDPDLRELDDGEKVAVGCEIRKSSGAPDLWVLEAAKLAEDNTDPLEGNFYGEEGGARSQEGKKGSKTREEKEKTKQQPGGDDGIVSGVESLAGSNESSGDGLQRDNSVSEGGDVRTDIANEKGGGLNSIEYSGRVGARINSGVSSISEHCPGQSEGTRNTDTSLSQTENAQRVSPTTASEFDGSNQQNATGSISQLAATNTDKLAPSSLLPPRSSLSSATAEEIITKKVFSMQEPPRWVILYNLDSILLLDRSKWPEKRYLRFDLTEIFGRRTQSTLKAMAALLCKSSISPGDDIPLLDTLSENSHKHAFAVSEDLKYSAREAIELLGNEAVWYLRDVRKMGIFGSTKGAERVDPEQLTRELLRYLYRLLFLFYIEARDELGYVPFKSEAYRTGYSLESLRELEMVNLVSEETKNGYFINESLQKLFELIFNGYNNEAIKQDTFDFDSKPEHNTFSIASLKTHLFDPERTSLINKVKFRNSTLQKVIQLLSLSRPAKGKKRRGRISYAQLGINQLGAVYEGLLSYSGFFAETDLHEVKKAGEEYDALKNAFFVKEEDLEKYKKEEIVFNDDGTFKIYPRGTYIYRLSGRNREKSASYYTPEVLTQCVVKYSLKELLKDKTADDILHLKVCEPAMGSGAFLNEAVNQLSEAYLQQKQQEVGETIGHDIYIHEKQKVKAYIADNNVYGVDLNPTAVELAEVSLYLNCIYSDQDSKSVLAHHPPWFGMQLATGNSLIGARRQVFNSDMLGKDKSRKQTWMDVVPDRIPLDSEEPRPARTVYHFLLPDKGMCDYKDKVVKSMAEEEFKKIKEWRTEFTKTFDDSDIIKLERLSEAVDKLWKKHVDLRKALWEQTHSDYELWGDETTKDTKGTKKALTTREKDKILDELLYSKSRNSSAYRRLKLAMDYWCALWFWPIQEADKLPTREQFLTDLALILEGKQIEVAPTDGSQFVMDFGDRPEQVELSLEDEFGYVDVDKLCGEIPRLRIVAKGSERSHFMHWELEFAEVFADNGGFDLIVGNPPWIKIDWNEGGILGDFSPLTVIRKYNAAKMGDLRFDTIQKFNILEDYFLEFIGSEATQNFFNSLQNFSILKSVQTNLYKCFIPIAWCNTNKKGISGFLHPEGIYDDPHGGKFREQIYPRLKYHFQFQNEYKLFPEVDNTRKYSVNIYSNKQTNIFYHIANLYLPKTIDSSIDHSGAGCCIGIKDENGNWGIKGHQERVIQVTPEILAMFAKLYDDPGTPALQAKLPALHSNELVKVLLKILEQNNTLGNLKGQCLATGMWDETNAQKDGTIKRQTKFHEFLESLILSGPHFYLGNPLNQTPRRICETNRSYDSLDLTVLGKEYLPRTNYVISCSSEEYSKRIPRVPWDNKKVVHFYRLCFRAMIGSQAEKTCICSILPKKVSHINGVKSIVFKEIEHLLSANALASSAIGDFFVKTTGRTNLHSIWHNFPLLPPQNDCKIRCLILLCLIEPYKDLWQKCWQENYKQSYWTKNDPRLDSAKFANLTPEWTRECALRTDYERRQALVEIDVLVAQELRLTLEELCAIYRIQFPVLRQNENDTWYDRNGRIVFTCSKGLSYVGLSRPEFEKHDLKKLEKTELKTEVEDPDGFTCVKEMQDGYVEREVEEDIMPDYRKSYGTFKIREGRGGKSEEGNTKNNSSHLPPGSSLSSDSWITVEGPLSETDYPDPIPGPVTRIIRYYAPFDKCDREEDYKTAWEEFERRKEL